MTGSGLLGTVVAVEGDTITLESAPGSRSRWVRAAIAKMIEPTAVDDDADDELDDDLDDEADEADDIEVPDDLSSLDDTDDDSHGDTDEDDQDGDEDGKARK